MQLTRSGYSIQAVVASARDPYLWTFTLMHALASPLVFLISITSFLIAKIHGNLSLRFGELDGRNELE